MSGYLHHLAFRTTDESNCLRPRLPSQFEPNDYAFARTPLVDALPAADEPAGTIGEEDRASEMLKVPVEPGRVPPQPMTLAAENSNEDPISETHRNSKDRELENHSRQRPQSEHAERDLVPRLHQNDSDSEARTTRAGDTSEFERPELSKGRHPNGNSATRPDSTPTRKEAATIGTVQIVPSDSEAQIPRVGRSDARPVKAVNPRKENVQPNALLDSDSLQIQNSEAAAADEVFAEGGNWEKERTEVESASDRTVSFVHSRNPATDDVQGTHRGTVPIRSEDDARGASPASPILMPALIQPASPEVPQRMSKSDENQAPNPTVKVTIGRIDIKATPADERPRKRQRSDRPAMSLNEYLQQRGAGGEP